MYLKCEWCGKVFYVKKLSNRGEHHYCSQDCITARDRNNYIVRFMRENKTFRLIHYESKNEVTIACRTCGDRVTTSSTNAIRRSVCLKCDEKRREAKRTKDVEIQELKAECKAQLKRLNKLRKELDKAYEKRIKEESRKERTKETRRAVDKRRELTRNKRIRNNGKLDKDISLKRLYERDKGVCYLCGGKCDYKDCKTTEKGYFIVGAYYPSIDHVVALSKGGTHTWDNIKLAHFICNSKKSDNPAGLTENAK